MEVIEEGIDFDGEIEDEESNDKSLSKQLESLEEEKKLLMIKLREASQAEQTPIPPGKCYSYTTVYLYEGQLTL